MMFIVDGTGDANPDAYDKEMSGGFCKRLEKFCRGQYWRGPALWGTQTSSIADEVVDAVVQLKKGPFRSRPVFLAGHSRGGAAVIFAAQELQKRGIDVEAMFLFDAVQRTINTLRGADTIPGNVKHCYHALRDPSLAFYYSDGVTLARNKAARCIGLPDGWRSSTMEDMLDLAMRPPVKPGPCATLIRAAREIAEQDYKMKLVMRSVTMDTPDGMTVNFGNCGLDADPKCKLEKETFLGSHGAIGGAPIVDHRAPVLLKNSDRAAMAAVGAWMFGHINRHQAFKTQPPGL